MSFLRVFSTFSHNVNCALLLCHKGTHVCIFFLLPSTSGISLSSFWQVQAPHTKSQLQLVRAVHLGPCIYVFFPISSLNPLTSLLSVPPPSPCLALALALSLSFLVLLSCPPQSWTVSLLYFARGGGVLVVMDGPSRMTIDPINSIPTTRGRSTSDFHGLPGRHCLHQASRSAVRCCSASRMEGDLHPTKNRL